ncbi:zf-HC2 domain-containing protein [Sphaerisporangium corydalis]|uniref:Zf-HC2 domain-containing protein n=1 Tax=Sphaerisporangium corydalis TaxID=1441875 RepID=A0ABV9EI25_9ACTN|nr:zf-HC2 domain-containing protein [Sphaerisporangium corydalis]
MTGDTHYDLEILAELAEGLLDDATAVRVREHLAVCDPCGESLADLAAVREMLAAVPVPAMPMGVALRIDKALGAEAENRQTGGGLRLDEAPDWDRIMGDSPWETASPMPLTAVTPPAPALPAQRSAPVEPRPEEVVRLGVVADDGSIVRTRRGKSSRRRSWAMPAAASVAAAVVIGAAGFSATLLSASGGGQPSGNVALPQLVPAETSQAPGRATADEGTTKPGLSYAIGKSDFNYSSTVLNGPLATYVGATGPGSGGDASVDPAVVRCVTKISERVGRKNGSAKAPQPIGVDQALYQGNEATVMAFWKDRMRNAVWVYVMDSNCASMRQPAVGRWQ